MPYILSRQHKLDVLGHKIASVMEDPVSDNIHKYQFNNPYNITQLKQCLNFLVHLL